MTEAELLDLCAVADDPDEYLRLIAEVLSLRWPDGSPVVELTD